MEDIVINIQPVYNYSINTVEFSEVLIRQYKGIKGPKNILDYILSNNTHKQFDLDVLNEAFNLAKEQDIILSVNLTHKTIEEQSLIDDIINILGNNRESIIFEINEETDFSNSTVQQNILKLKELNFKLALDDYGLFNSSLDVLTKYPFDIIKIDKDFKDNKNEMIKLKHVLSDKGLCSVVEGVEDTEQLKELIHLGYYIIQGYVYAGPLCIYDFGRIKHGK